MNKIILLARLSKDPEVRYSQGENALAIARYTLAVDRRAARREGEPTASAARAMTTDQRQPLISWRATNSRPEATPAPYNDVLQKFWQLLSESKSRVKSQCPGVRIRLALALPVPCHVPLTKFISQSQCSHLLNEENSNLLQVAGN